MITKEEIKAEAARWLSLDAEPTPIQGFIDGAGWASSRHYSRIQAMSVFNAALRDENERLSAENAALRAALQDLYDEQNGVPLIRREKQWQAAMNAAHKLLK